MKRTKIQTLFGNADAFSGDVCGQIGAPVHAPIPACTGLLGLVDVEETGGKHAP